MELVTLDKQLNLSPYYLKPDCHGSCLPKDLKGLRLIARQLYKCTAFRWHRKI